MYCNLDILFFIFFYFKLVGRTGPNKQNSGKIMTSLNNEQLAEYCRILHTQKHAFCRLISFFDIEITIC